MGTLMDGLRSEASLVLLTPAMLRWLRALSLSTSLRSSSVVLDTRMLPDLDTG